MPASSVQSPYDAALDFLVGRIDYERTVTVPYGDLEFRLERMRLLLSRLGDPHLALKVVHVAGTKGKGSTSSMTAAIVSAAGYKTGLYSSPHLHRIEERFALDGQICPSEQFVSLVDQVRPTVERLDREVSHPSARPTYFEVTTAMAMLYFAQAKVDAAVLEVGLGGRLDSTNVCRPSVCVITSISYDHIKQLGSTLTAIASEKAGIIKLGVPVVSGVTQDEPRDVIRRIARERNCSLSELGEQFDFNFRAARGVENSTALGRMDYRYQVPGQEHEYRGLTLGLLGRHQATNAAVTLATIAELQKQGWTIREPAVRDGLQNVGWPARIEIISRKPLVIIDAAHNVASIQSLIETLDESVAVRRRILIFATTHEKDCAGMLRLLLPKFDEVIFTKYSINPRGISAKELQSLATELSPKQVHVCESVGAAWQTAASLADPADLICATGSFFLAAELRTAIGAANSNYRPTGRNGGAG